MKLHTSSYLSTDRGFFNRPYKIIVLLLHAATALLLFLVPARAQGSLEKISLSLHDGWYIHTSEGLVSDGSTISTPEFRPDRWLKTSIPATPIGAQVEHGDLPSPYVGGQSRTIPGWTYKVGRDYSNQDWVHGSPYAKDWWFLNQFVLPPALGGRHIYLHFDAINYRANLWVNGRLIADNKHMVGAFTAFEYDITGVARPGKMNSVALDITGPSHKDLSMTFVDWSPMPADRNLGIWRGVWITSSGPVKLRFPQVQSDLATDLASAALTVSAGLSAPGKAPVVATLRGVIIPGNITFSQRVSLSSGGIAQVVKFLPDRFPRLNLRRPALWWPAGLGPQNLYTCRLQVFVDGTLSDEAAFRFGIRRIETGLNSPDSDTEEQYRWFKVNNHPVLIKAGGWSYDMLLKYSRERRIQELLYARDLNLNSIRMEGTMEDQEFYDLADRYGLLIIAGWVCCSQWENWASWSPENTSVALASMDTQMKALRNHPAAFLWMNGSDLMPPPEVESKEVEIQRTDNWPNPVVSNADYSESKVTGISGVKMKGPYQWVPPIFWYANDTDGGAFGFATEISPGPEVPPMESLKSTFDPEPIPWPINNLWNLHMGGAVYGTLDIVSTALNRRYGVAATIEDYVRKSQAENYECTRAMFEAYEANKSKTDGTASTGVVQWQLNKGWPSLHWQLYDWHLRPGGAYFGAKKASEPLHIMWDYAFQNAVYVTNDYRRGFSRLTANIDIFDFGLAPKYHFSAPVDVPAASSKIAIHIPSLEGLSGTYFIKLKLRDAANRILSDNFYWYSTTEDEMPPHCQWFCLPREYADMSALSTLPIVNVRHSERASEDTVTVTLTNTGSSLAFLTRATVSKNNRELLPVFWSDNYVSLMPGESKTLTARFRPGSLPKGAVVKVDGFNVNPN
ncbi:MAG TPA: hypothetical protein VI756_29185 [Blastocatellia bacterium]